MTDHEALMERAITTILGPRPNLEMTKRQQVEKALKRYGLEMRAQGLREAWNDGKSSYRGVGLCVEVALAEVEQQIREQG